MELRLLLLAGVLLLAHTGCKGCKDGGDGTSTDRDGDGFDATEDCDDDDPAAYPGGPERFDGNDGDCNGVRDDVAYDQADFCMEGKDRYLLGVAAEPVPDQDGDGYDGFMVGAPGFTVAGSSYDEANGAVYVFDGEPLFGPAPSPTPAEAAHLVIGSAAGGRFGVEIASLDDADGDGVADLLMVADRHRYLPDGTGQDSVGMVSLYLSTLGGLEGAYTGADAQVTFYGEDARERFGSTTTAYGDVDGDGLSDFGLAARLNSDNQGMFVFLGRGPSEWGVSYTSADADAVLAAAESLDTYAIQSGRAGDFDGDGYGDALVGVGTHDVPVTNAGVVYLALGSAEGFDWWEDLESQADFAFLGSDEGDGETGEYLGWAMTSVPDLDGDGDDEVAMSGFYDGTAGEDAGAVYLVLGEPVVTGIPGAFEGPTWRASASEAATAKIVAPSDHDVLGWSLAPIPDLDGDGLWELGVSSPYATAGELVEPGKAWVLGAQAYVGAGVATVDDHVLASVAGVRDRQGVGGEIRSGGDLDADGLPDLLVGAFLDDAGGDRRGTACVFLNQGEGDR